MERTERSRHLKQDSPDQLPNDGQAEDDRREHCTLLNIAGEEGSSIIGIVDAAATLKLH